MLNDLKSDINIFTISLSNKTKFEKIPLPPFIFSSAVKEICNRFSITSEQAGSILQNLYENGCISYHRTDNPNLSAYFRNNVKLFVEVEYGNQYFQNRTYESKNNNAQEAHEGIRPTNINIMKLDQSDSLESKIYEIIWKRAVASQMSNVIYDIHTVNINPSNRKEGQFIYKKTSINFDGYTKVYDTHNNNNDDDDDKDNEDDSNDEDILNNIIKNDAIDLTKLKIGDKINNILINTDEKVRKPPSRFNEGTLIKKMEDIGVGRPSTYVNVIKKLFTRDFINKQTIKGKSKELDNFVLKDDTISENKVSRIMFTEKNVLVPCHGAEVTASYLEKNFENLVDYKYTASLENELDKIASNEVDRTIILNKFYSNFQQKVINAQSSIDTDISRLGKFTLEEALDIINSSKGQTNTLIYNNTTIVIKPPIKGKETYYFQYLGQLYSILPYMDPCSINQEDILKCIESKQFKILYDFKEFKVFNGTYGPYISIPNEISNVKPFTYISINTNIYDINKITKNECLEIIKGKTNNKKKSINENSEKSSNVTSITEFSQTDTNTIVNMKKVTSRKKRMKLYD